MSVLSLQSKFDKKNLEKLGGEILSISPFENEGAKNIISEISSLEYVLAMIIQKTTNYLNHLDTGELSGESNVGEEEICEIIEFLDSADYVVLDKDFFMHKSSHNMEIMVSLMAEKFNLKILDENLNELKLKTGIPQEPLIIDDYNGVVIYLDENVNGLVGGKFFLNVAKINDGDLIEIKFDDKTIKTKFTLNPNLKGVIGLLGYKKDRYPFVLAEIKKDVK